MVGTAAVSAWAGGGAWDKCELVLNKALVFKITSFSLVESYQHSGECVSHRQTQTVEFSDTIMNFYQFTRCHFP
jgi:hypothetical protein